MLIMMEMALPLPQRIKIMKKIRKSMRKR